MRLDNDDKDGSKDKTEIIFLPEDSLGSPGIPRPISHFVHSDAAEGDFAKEGSGVGGVDRGHRVVLVVEEVNKS